MSLGHSHASMAATLAYRVLSAPLEGVMEDERRFPVKPGMTTLERQFTQARLSRRSPLTPSASVATAQKCEIEFRALLALHTIY
jgi:hypothetical protein